MPHSDKLFKVELSPTFIIFLSGPLWSHLRVEESAASERKGERGVRPPDGVAVVSRGENSAAVELEIFRLKTDRNTSVLTQPHLILHVVDGLGEVLLNAKMIL